MIDDNRMTASERSLHALNRLAFGPRAGDVEVVNRIGAERWILQQLEPESIPENPDLERRLEALATLRMTPVELFLKYQLPVMMARRNAPDAAKPARLASRGIVQQAVEARIIRAIEGRRRLQEVMTDFWFNHFNVFAGKGLCHLWVGAYEEEAVRPHIMGRFRDLLGATAKHPAMLFYLDNWQNTDPDSPGRRGKLEGINENYAREVMELHTLGVDGGYTQADVIALAHILTGWGLVGRQAGAKRRWWRRERRAVAEFRFPRRNSHPDGEGADDIAGKYGFFFDPSRHDSKPVTFLGHQINGGGIDQGETALDILAQSPATARHLAYQLTQYFVADRPPPGLVDTVARQYTASDGRIREMLGTIFTSAEFWDQRAYASKFKTPYEFVISSVRASGAPVMNVRPLAGAMALLGMPLYGCQTPDGYKNTQEAWLNPDALIMRLNFATALGAGRLPLNRRMDEFAPGAAANEPEGAIGPAGKTIPPAFPGGRMEPPDPAEVAITLGGMISSHTRGVVESAPPRLQSALLLGCPEFMMR